jgi:Na+-transporting NADH:ubiquinone oxidoreductase subunit F
MSKVRVTVNGKTAEVEPGTSLLMAAYRAGARLPFPCGAQGACSMCRVRVVEGGESLAAESGFMRLWRGLHVSFSAQVRLACQTSVQGPGPVVVEGVFSKA